MIKNIFFIASFAFISQLAFSQTNIVAKVIDADTKEPIPYLTVKYADGKGVITNDEGDFNIHLETTVTETDSIELSYIGYQKQQFALKDFN